MLIFIYRASGVKTNLRNLFLDTGREIYPNFRNRKCNNLPKNSPVSSCLDTTVLLDKRRICSGLASIQCKLFANTDENAKKC